MPTCHLHNELVRAKSRRGPRKYKNGPAAHTTQGTKVADEPSQGAHWLCDLQVRSPNDAERSDLGYRPGCPWPGSMMKAIDSIGILVLIPSLIGLGVRNVTRLARTVAPVSAQDASAAAMRPSIDGLEPGKLLMPPLMSLAR